MSCFDKMPESDRGYCYWTIAVCIVLFSSVNLSKLLKFCYIVCVLHLTVNFWYDMAYDIRYCYYKFVENLLTSRHQLSSTTSPAAAAARSSSSLPVTCSCGNTHCTCPSDDTVDNHPSSVHWPFWVLAWSWSKMTCNLLNGMLNLTRPPRICWYSS